MHLQLGPETPFLIRAAAEAALVLHIGGGTVGLAAGAVALSARKGGPIHRVSGKVFLGAMLVSMVVGAIVAPMIGQPMNSFGGFIAIYLMGSAWLTVTRPAGQVGRAEMLALLVPLVSAPVMFAFGWVGAHSGKGGIDGVPYQAGYVAAAVSALLAATDIKVVLSRGVSGAQRLARHLWRMCVALFLASGSLFLGQPKVFPAPLRGSLILWILALAPLALMIFWLIRVRRTSARKSPTSKPVRTGVVTQEAI
jgi:uncharacterized membrane protein